MNRESPHENPERNVISTVFIFTWFYTRIILSRSSSVMRTVYLSNRCLFVFKQKLYFKVTIISCIFCTDKLHTHTQKMSAHTNYTNTHTHTHTHTFSAQTKYTHTHTHTWALTKSVTTIPSMFIVRKSSVPVYLKHCYFLLRRKNTPFFPYYNVLTCDSTSWRRAVTIF